MKFTQHSTARAEINGVEQVNCYQEQQGSSRELVGRKHLRKAMIRCEMMASQAIQYRVCIIIINFQNIKIYDASQLERALNETSILDKSIELAYAASFAIMRE